MTLKMPPAIATVVGEILGEYYYTHSAIETLLYENGAKGDPPPESVAGKVTAWLIREGNEDPDKAFTILGGILREFMDDGITRFSSRKSKDANVERIEAILNQYDLSYGFGGKIYGATLTAPSRDLGEKLRDLSIPEIEDEFERAYRSVESDPPTAVTAACAILEALCKSYINTNGLELPAKQTMANLWKAVSKHLELAPASELQSDLNRILSGLASIIDGVSAFRTHAGNAHGRSANAFRVTSRYARLAVHAAHTACLFVMETAVERKERDA